MGLDMYLNARQLSSRDYFRPDLFNKLVQEKPGKKDVLEYFKKRIEQLDKDINSMIEYQKQLDEKITEYNKEILKIDSTISNIKVKKEVVNNYYEQKGKEIKNSNAKQVDSLLRSRYNF